MGPNTPAVDVEQEVRFAVVMYGGVSLAIYMNGIVQELFNMVKATAQNSDGTPRYGDGELRGSQRVYRNLARQLGRAGAFAPAVRGDTPIRTRFVVDSLSGSSAGGINAVALAKALANGQDVAGLKELWVDEGDIAKLINDRESADWGLPPQEPPLSLLSSQRMYAKLVDAFDAMESRDAPSSATDSRGYVDELDLFVTATDLGGLPVPLRLSDGVVVKMRHRNVFSFRYDSGRTGRQKNDFHAHNNAFLAFVARCTSAFPFAFEPMRLTDINAVLKVASKPWHQGVSGHDRPRWQPYFPSYRRSGFVERAFADCGYLDNKPFGHAVDALSRRSASVPVAGKLIYLEPSPESIRLNGDAPPSPNAVENVMAAFTLARYETIHQDLQRIVNHNRSVQRMETLMRGLEEDVGQAELGDYETSESYGQLYLDDLVRQPGMGIAYGGYHRLKVAKVTDEIARLVAAACGFNEQSDELLAIGLLVRAWRAARFVRYRQPDKDTASESMFLLRYDLSYRLRRLKFVLLKIDQLAGLGAETRGLLEHMAMRVPAGGEMATFRSTLMLLRAALVSQHEQLRYAYARLRESGPASPLAAEVAGVVKEAQLEADSLRAILEQDDEGTRRRHATKLLAAAEPAFEQLAEKLAEEIAGVTKPAAKACQDALRHAIADPSEAERNALQLVSNYYANYERYDLIVFPALQSTGIGDEFSQVEVLRISPEDAKSIVDEQTGKTKLAGTALMNFGAFLDRGWRKNDILWGRLDGAERILAALLPDGELRRALTTEAHQEILADEFNVGQSQVSQGLADEMAVGTVAGHEPTFLKRVAALLKRKTVAAKAGGTPLAEGLQLAHAQQQHPEAYKQILYDAFKEEYQVDRQPNPRLAVRAMARATRVTGQIFEQIADAYQVDRRPGRWIAKLGSIIWGLIEVAVPNSFGNLLFRHWLKLLYTFEVFIVFAGLLVGFREAQWFGLALLVITSVVHLATWLLGNWMAGRKDEGRH